MINKPSGYDNAQPYTSQEQLPPGGYVLQIVKTEVANYTWGDVLIVGFEIKEGEYAGFFRKNFDNQTENKKWKGTFRLTIPTDSDQDDRNLRKFKSNIMAIEKANEEYKWNWDEATLKGKLVGGLFGRKEYEFNGNRGFYTECRQFCGTDRIREGNFDIPKDRLLQDSNTTATQSATGIPQGFSAVDDSDIPF